MADRNRPLRLVFAATMIVLPIIGVFDALVSDTGILLYAKAGAWILIDILIVLTIRSAERLLKPLLPLEWDPESPECASCPECNPYVECERHE